MSVPEDIRKVERPVNTVVVDTKSKGIYRYAVRERKRSVCKTGYNPSPRNGKTIGHIINYKYEPIVSPVQQPKAEPFLLSYGSSALVQSISADVVDDLLSVFDPKTAYTIITIASLRIIKPRVTCSRLDGEYKKSFFYLYYQGIKLSKNTVSKFLYELGGAYNKIHDFYAKRMQRVAEDHHIAIDGTLIHDTSVVNDLSSYSRKARVSGCKDISIIYAYDIELMEPLCCEVLPGKVTDAGAYRDFIVHNEINKGIIITDKGFPPSQIQDLISDNNELHYISPLKRNDSKIKKYEMVSFTGVLEGVAKTVLYKKQKISENKYLYAFRDENLRYKESHDYLERANRNNDFNQDEYESKDKIFGLIVFESDLDLEPKLIYENFESRWLIEVTFDRYKNDIGANVTAVQKDLSVMGSDFINFISTLLTSKMLRKIESTTLLEKLSYGNLLEDLAMAWRRVDKTDNPLDKPRQDDGKWIHTTKKVHSYLEELGLSEPLANESSENIVKKGRPRKHPPKERKQDHRGRPRIYERSEDSQSGVKIGYKTSSPSFVGPKRPRGRPRKTMS